MDYYDVAQICLNGHVIAATAGSSPKFQQEFCSTCGAKTIMNCPACAAPIRGYYHVEGVIGFFDYDRPAFCHTCREPFPWTRDKIKAAKELARELDGLTDEERELVATSIDDLVADTPRTELAANRFKRVGKASAAGANALRGLIVDIASETAKKILTG